MPPSSRARAALRFTPTRRARVSSEILQQLKSAILTRRLRPGDKLPSEKALAEQFQSSRGSIREAIRSLEQAGLLTVRRGFGGGAVVADGDLRQVTDSLSLLIRLGNVSIRHLTEARLLLEPRIASLAARHVTEGELAELGEYIEKHEQAIEAGRLHASADLGFHRLIARAGKNPVLLLFINAMADLMVQEVVARLHMDTATNRTNLRFHKRIHQALQRRDAETASRLMLEHVEEVQDRLERLLPPPTSRPSRERV